MGYKARERIEGTVGGGVELGAALVTENQPLDCPTLLLRAHFCITSNLALASPYRKGYSPLAVCAIPPN